MKRGRGGIREIEFYAQAHQMIWGGRDERLRAPATLDALAALTEAGHVSQGDAMLLADSYRLFRRIEHRLQMVEDQQTHLVPKQKLAREAIAALDGAPDWKALESDLVHRSREVARLYDKLIAVGDDEGGPRGPRIPHAPDDVERWAAQARLADPALATSLIASWRRGRARSLRAPESRRAFEVVLPGLLTALGRGPGGREAMLRLDRMIGALPYGVQVWRLLKAHPELAETLARLLTATPWLADSLAARPQRLDVLLSPPPPLETVEDALAELHHAVRGLGEEAFLDRVRVWTHERQFHAAVSLLDGAASPLAVARLLSLLAEAAVVVLAEQVEAGFAARHGIVPESEFVALALGRFGGGELTFQSDLDLVFLFTGDWKASSDGIEPITASARWNRFATRLVAALSVPTAAGRLHEVDTRLRPSGADGLLAVSLDSFTTYQTRDAELWETMALTRARPITGSRQARAAAKDAIAAIIRGPHQSEKVLREAQAIRAHMAAHKPSSGPMDLKLGRGGLVDLEFVVQARALLAGQPVPADLAGAARIVAPELVEAAILLSSALVVLRLVEPA
ncbi:MAG: glutamine-synthetase adenylyltransferase, partial [Thermaurantiacus sp.]